MFGAALAYYTLFSLAPFIILLVSLTGMVWGREAVQGELFAELRGLVGVDGAKTIEHMVAASSRPLSNFAAALIGVVTLIIGATAVFGQLQQAMYSVWDVEPAGKQGFITMLRQRWASFSMVIAFGFLLLVSLVLSALLNFLAAHFSQRIPFPPLLLEAANSLLGFFVTAGIFAAMFRLLSGVVLRWRDVLYGSVVTAVLFTVGKTLLGMYIGQSAFSSSYGAAGALVVVLVWVYYSAQIFLFGAELTRVLMLRSELSIIPRPGLKLSGPYPRLISTSSQARRAPARRNDSPGTVRVYL